MNKQSKQHKVPLSSFSANATPFDGRNGIIAAGYSPTHEENQLTNGGHGYGHGRNGGHGRRHDGHGRHGPLWRPKCGPNAATATTGATENARSRCF